ncbi:MAG: DUF72 domain-containing protein [Spirochaetales bacterium]
MLPIRIGTSGYTYPQWKKVFYPEELSTSSYFNYYQTYFSTVELNYTFYHVPRQSTVVKWYREASTGFVYSVKVPRAITHLQKLSSCEESLRSFLFLLSSLREKLGGLLFQFPPSFKYSPEQLQKILRLKDLLQGYLPVLEFRHRSWFEADLSPLFSAGFSVATVSAPSLPFVIPESTPHLYLRLHGRTAWYRSEYSTAELEELARIITEQASRNKPVWIYFNNDLGGCAIRNALTLKNLLGV